MCSKQDPLSLFKRLQMGKFGFSLKETVAKSVAMATTEVSFCFFCDVDFWCQFEEHCSNISRDILDSVFNCSSGTIYDVITFLICTKLNKNVNISKMKKDISKRKMPFFLTLKSLSNKQQLLFLLHSHFKCCILIFSNLWSESHE